MMVGYLDDLKVLRVDYSETVEQNSLSVVTPMIRDFAAMVTTKLSISLLRMREVTMLMFILVVDFILRQGFSIL